MFLMWHSLRGDKNGTQANKLKTYVPPKQENSQCRKQPGNNQDYVNRSLLESLFDYIRYLRNLNTTEINIVNIVNKPVNVVNKHSLVKGKKARRFSDESENEIQRRLCISYVGKTLNATCGFLTLQNKPSNVVICQVLGIGINYNDIIYKIKEQ